MVENVDISLVLDNLILMNRANEDHRFIGRMSSFNVWKSALSLEKKTLWTKCMLNDTGSLIDWETSQWKLVDCNEGDEDCNICERKRTNVLFFNLSLTFEESVVFCRSLGAENIAPVSREATFSIIDQLNKQVRVKQVGTFVWTGINDQNVDGVYTDGHGKELESIKAWYTSEPNGGKAENCVELRVTGPRTGTLNDNNCKR